MALIQELLEYLGKRNFSCNLRETKGKQEEYVCKRDGRSLLVLRVENEKRSLSIESRGIEEELKDFISEDREGFKDFVLEFQGIVADLKVLSIKKGLLLQDKLLPFLEELMLEEGEE